MRTKTTILNPWRFSLKKTMLLLTMVLGVAFVWQTNAQTPEVPIGEQDGSTSYLPIYSCYEYSYSQQLVYSSEINASGDITSISFFYNNSTATTNEDSVDWDIYLGHTPKTAFSDTEDWVDYASLEEVFSGTVTFPAEGEWMTITFDNPFPYNGADNLVVGVDQNTSGFNCSIYFGKTEDMGVDRSLYYRNDSNNPDPINPPTDPGFSGGTNTYINTMILGGIQQSCPFPSELAVSDIAQTTATIAWTENGSADEWEVIYGESGFDVETEGTTISVSTDPSTSLINLDHSTQYDFYVKAICSEDDESNFAGPMTFITDCDIATIPYLMDFESAEVPDLPNCTTQENNGTVGNDWQTKSSISNFDGKVLNYSYHPSTELGNANTWFYTQGIELEAGVNYDISYKYGNNSTTWAESMKVAYGTSPEEADMTNELADYPEIELNSPEEELITFSVDTDGIYFFGFNAYSIENQNQLYVDDIQIDFSPACPLPTDLTASNISESTADLAWTDNAEATQWEVVYGETEFDPETQGTTVTANDDPEITITDLGANTQYDFYVKAICDINDESEWVGPYDFRTACDVIENLPYTENFDTYGTGSDAFPFCWERPITYVSGTTWPSIVLQSNAPSSPNALKFQSSDDEPTYAVSPSFSEDINNLRVTFMLKREGASSGTIDVGVMSDANEISTFELVQTIDPDDNNFNEYIFDLNQVELSGSDNYIALKHNSNSSYWYYWLDDFEVDLIPTCPAPTNLSVADITEDSADVSWTESMNATQWEVIYGEAGFDVDTEGETISVNNDPNIQLTDLSPNTNYDVYVLAICEENDVSTLTGPLNFYTACLATDIPFTQNFEDVTAPDIPNCAQLETNNGEGWETYEQTSYGFDSNVLRHKWTSIGSGPVDAWYFTQGINLEAGVNYQISYLYGSNSSTLTEKLKVAYGSSANSAAMTEELADHEFTFSTAEENEITFSVDTDGVYYFGFQSHSEENQYWLLLDDIHIDIAEEEPGEDCEAPTDAEVTEITDTTADVSWTAGADETQWEVLYGEAGFDTDSEGESVVVEVTTYTIAELDPETEYDVYVRSVCGEDDFSDWTGPETFNTDGESEVDYCEPSLDCIDGDRITNVTFQEINNDTECSEDGYGDYTDQIAEVNPGGTYNISVTVGDGWMNEAVSVWIDYDESETFDEDEFTFVGVGSDETLTQSITIPDDVTEGTYRMRVRVAAVGEDTATWDMACDETQGYGETEDYTVNVVEGEPADCEAPTDAEVTEITDTTADVSWTAGADEDQWEVMYGEAGFDTGSEGESVLVEVTTYTIAELDPETEYEVYVRAVCGEDDVSDWTGPESFTTEEEAVEDCEAPTNIEVTDVTETTAAVSWTPQGDEQIWALIYGESGFDQEDEDEYQTDIVLAPTHTIEELQPETDYDVYVYAICDEDEMIYSDQVGPITFTTDDLSVDSQEFNNFTFYPNPVENQLSLKAGTQIENVQMFNLLGQQVIEAQPNSLETQINTESLQSGVYLMEVSINGNQKTFRVLKK